MLSTASGIEGGDTRMMPQMALPLRSLTSDLNASRPNRQGCPDIGIIAVTPQQRAHPRAAPVHGGGDDCVPRWERQPFQRVIRLQYTRLVVDCTRNNNGSATDIMQQTSLHACMHGKSDGIARGGSVSQFRRSSLLPHTGWRCWGHWPSASPSPTLRPGAPGKHHRCCGRCWPPGHPRGA